MDLKTNSFFILLNTFQLGFIWNAVIRRITMDPYPSDTIYPILIGAVLLFMYIPLFLARRQINRDLEGYNVKEERFGKKERI